jgi:hypothetical protein
VSTVAAAAGASGDTGIAAAGNADIIAKAPRAAAPISRKRFIWQFSLGPRLRGGGQCRCPPEVPSKVSLTSVLIAGRAIARQYRRPCMGAAIDLSQCGMDKIVV